MASFDSTYDFTFDTDGTGDSTITPTGDVQTLAFGRMPIQFRDKPIIMGVLQCVLPSVQSLMDTIATVRASFNPNVATGQSLTNLGKLVGLPRITTVDDDFRRYVRAQIAVNKSLATFTDVIKVAVLILGDTTYTVTLHNEGTATARLRIGSTVGTAGAVTPTVGSILTTLAQAAVAAGVRLVVEWQESNTASTFRFDIGPGFNQGHLASSAG